MISTFHTFDMKRYSTPTEVCNKMTKCHRNFCQHRDMQVVSVAKYTHFLVRNSYTKEFSTLSLFLPTSEIRPCILWLFTVHELHNLLIYAPSYKFSGYILFFSCFDLLRLETSNHIHNKNNNHTLSFMCQFSSKYRCWHSGFFGVSRVIYGAMGRATIFAVNNALSIRLEDTFATCINHHKTFVKFATIFCIHRFTGQIESLRTF